MSSCTDLIVKNQSVSTDQTGRGSIYNTHGLEVMLGSVRLPRLSWTTSGVGLLRTEDTILTCQQSGIRHRSYARVLASVHAFGVQRDEAPMWQMCKQALTAEPHSLAGAVISRAWLGGTSQGTCQLQEPPMKPQQGLTLI